MSADTPPDARGPDRVLAALDISDYAAAVVRYAGWAACRLEAPLELLHVQDGDDLPASLYPGEVDVDPRFVLLRQLERERAAGAPAQTPGERLLQRACDFVHTEFGIAARPSLRDGDLARTLQADEGATRLYVIGKRGEYANIDSDHLGSQLEKVVRAVHRPLLVTSRHFQPPQRVLVAFDGSALAGMGLDAIAAGALFGDLDMRVLMVGNDEPPRQQQLQQALDTLQRHGHRAEGRIRRGPVDATILREIDDAQADLVVMGAYGHSRLRRMLFGSTTNHVLRTSKVPVLLLR
ncbi:MAG: universal stress protein [Pseudoxanthomonas suwonensis]|nr:universal stress protein [Pseudoxanthomonas suwonensis]